MKTVCLLTLKKLDAENSVSFTGEFLENTLKIGNVVEGKNAEVTINGFTIEREENEFSFGDINYSLLTEGTTTVQVGRDDDHMFEKIKNFYG